MKRILNSIKRFFTREMSPTLHHYLTGWLLWVENGAPDAGLYSRSCGLCIGAPGHLVAELILLFERDFGCGSFPFGQADYYARARNRTQHLCPKRLAWVKAKLGKN